MREIKIFPPLLSLKSDPNFEGHQIVDSWVLLEVKDKAISQDSRVVYIWEKQRETQERVNLMLPLLTLRC